MKPFSWLPTCRQNITEPGSGESSPARAWARCSCFSSPKKWKREDACIAVTRPCNGLSEVRLRRSGTGSSSGGLVGVLADATGETISRCFGSKTSPGTKAIGYVSRVVLKSLCPRSANSASKTQAMKSRGLSAKKRLPWCKSVVTTCSSGYPSAPSLRASFPTVL